MRIIIAGAGEVGVHLARMMTKEAQDIVIIDIDKERLQYIEGHIDVITIKGDASSLKVMDDANVDKADLLIAATSSETSNFTIAVLGKKFGAKKTIARLRSTEFTHKSLTLH